MIRLAGPKTVYIAELKPVLFISSDVYRPEITVRGEHVLSFTNREGLDVFPFPFHWAYMP